MKPSNHLENKTPYDTYWWIQLICKKVPAHSSLELQLQYNQDQMLWQIKIHYDLFNHLGSYRNIMQFHIRSRRKSK